MRRRSAWRSAAARVVSCSGGAPFRRAAMVQALEPRVHLAFSVDGTVGNDQISINVVGPLVTVTVNGVPTSELDALVSEIVVNGLGGDDTIRVGLNTDNAISVFGNEGDDTILVSDNSGWLSSLGSPTLNIWITGGAGADLVELNDSARNEAATHSVQPLGPDSAKVTATDITTAPLAPAINVSEIEALHLRGGGGDDVLRVEADIPGVDLSLDGGEGDDSFEIAGDGGPSARPVRIDDGGGLDDVSIYSGGVNAVLAGDQRLDFIRVDTGSLLQLASGAPGDRPVTTRALLLFGSGTLDVARQSVLIDYTGTSPLASIRQRLTSGYNFGAWNGTGITSSAAAATPSGSVGYADATELFTTFPAVFAGVPIDGTTLIIRHTISGDADLDRTVSLGDFSRLASNYNQLSTWAGGDFNFDNATGIADFSLLAGNYNLTLPVVRSGSALQGLWLRLAGLAQSEAGGE